MPRRVIAPWILLVSGLASACSGYSQRTHTHTLSFLSSPDEALVELEDGRGLRAIGRTPVAADVEVVSSVYEFNPWSVTWPTILCGGTIAGMAGFAAADVNGGGLAVFGLLAGIPCALSVLGTALSAAADGEVERTYYRHGPPKLKASLEGHTENTLLLSSNDPLPTQPIRFELFPRSTGPTLAHRGGSSADANAPVLGTLRLTPPAPAPRRVVAVFPVDARTEMDEKTLDALTEYLVTKLAETGRYRVVPRDELRRRLLDQKKASYEECVDESCRIELGKAVAAELAMSTRLLRVGTECALSSTVYDVRTETTEFGATVRTSCDEARLMDGVDQLIRKLGS